MAIGKDTSTVCAICGRRFARRQLTHAGAVRDGIVELIRETHPAWNEDSLICAPDLQAYRARYVRSLLQAERGELTQLEQEVLLSLHNHDLLSRNVDHDMQQQWSFGERLADRIATFGGSWAFLICFGLFLATWIALNTFVFVARPPDPYPFILLNLLLSCLAAIQAPIIMMSQNRQEAKDRARAQHDYQINMKAELEIRHLHEKMDHLLSHQWERLAQIQEIQLDLLSELGRRR